MVYLTSLGQHHQALSAMVDETLGVDDINLTNCDREPIHIPNAIQPHGLLVVFQVKTLEIHSVSANLEAWTFHSLESLKGRTLNALFDLERVQSIVEQLSKASSTQLAQPIRVELKRADGSLLAVNALVHMGESYAALEIEPGHREDSIDYFDFFEQIKAPIERLQRTQTLADLCNTAVREIQQITGFDRVMVYRFHPDGSGSVIAEAARDEAVPYLGLRYPSTDIPRQAKQLYAMNWLRIIPNVAYEPVPILSCTELPLPHPLDMSGIGLRSVSPIHVEYLQNMGVQASLSISLLYEGQLWGLIACHHHQAKTVPLPIRTCCEFIGQIMSAELAAKERHDVLSKRLEQKSVLNQLEQSIKTAQSLSEALTTSSDLLLNLVNATGAAYLEQDDINLIGVTPSEIQVKQIIKLLNPYFQDNSVYSTPQLSQIVPEAQAYSSQASGVLGLAISKTQQIYLLWFRPELPQIVNWAGNPNKPNTTDEEGQQPYLSPRQSFERWVETVLLSCEPWTSAEIETALELRSSIIGLVLQKADELAKVNLELARSNEDLAAFAYVASHDLKAPLRAIANLACWIQEDLEGKIPDETQTQLDLLQARVYRMHDMVQGLLQYSRAGQQAESIRLVSITELIKEVVDSLSPPSTIVIEVPQISTLYETNKTLLKQVLTNLLSNAIKYINRSDGKIVVQVQEKPDGLRFSVRDNGPGIEADYHDKIFQMFQTLQSRDDIESTGIGLAIVKKVVTTQGGVIQLQSQVGEGSTFIFTWPQVTPVKEA